MKFLKSVCHRSLSLLLALCCLLSLVLFSSCSLTDKKAVVEINDVKISNDVFVYFLDRAAVDLGVDANYSALESQTIALIYRYYKTNSLAHKEKISLSTAQKAAVSQEVDAAWSIYGDYYSKIGVKRETLTKIFTADAYRDALMLKYYGKGGSREVSDGQLYANFQANYVVFQAITGYLTQTDEYGVTTPLSQNDAETLVLKFQNILKTVSSGEQSMEEAAAYLVSTGLPGAVQTVVLHKDDATYPEGFFEQIKALEKRTATIVSTNEYIFLVVPGEITADSSYFKNVKNDILISFADSGIDKIIDDSIPVTGSVDSEAGEGYLEIIRYEKGE
jgi:hypothetical protein